MKKGGKRLVVTINWMFNLRNLVNINCIYWPFIVCFLVHREVNVEGGFLQFSHSMNNRLVVSCGLTKTRFWPQLKFRILIMTNSLKCQNVEVITFRTDVEVNGSNTDLVFSIGGETVKAPDLDHSD